MGRHYFKMDRNQQWFDVLLFIGVCFLGLCLAQFLAMLCLLPFHDFDVASLKKTLDNPLGFPELKMQLIFIQGVSHLVAFIIAPLVFIRWREGNWKLMLYRNVNGQPSLILLAMVLTIVSLPFIGLLVEWNQAVQLPSFMRGIESWAKGMEDHAEGLTNMLTSFSSAFEFAVAFVVIAILPAIGEELVFRGYLQNKINELTGSAHFAILLAAALFSAIHFQFYGFLPRMALGAMFGYLYYYTGQFHLAVVAHFTNNALTLILLYLKQRGVIAFDIDNEQQVPLVGSLISLLVTLLLFVLIMRQVKPVSRWAK